MSEEYLNKKVRILENNGIITYGEILYWVEEKGERPFILINNKCIYIDEIKEIKEIEDTNK